MDKQQKISRQVRIEIYNNSPLAEPAQLHRVGASIGHKSPTLHTLLAQHIPDLITDEEDGLVAMFTEIHRSIPDPQMHVAMRSALARLWQFWNQVQDSEVSRVLTDDQVGMAAFIKEVGDSTAMESRQALQSATQFLDAMLARMLHSFAQTTQTASEISELVAPTPRGVIEDDVSLRGMFREVSQQFPRMQTKEVERHLLGRLQQISEESALDTNVVSK